MSYLDDANKEVDRMEDEMRKKELAKQAEAEAKSKLAKEQKQHEDNKKQGMI